MLSCLVVLQRCGQSQHARAAYAAAESLSEAAPDATARGRARACRRHRCSTAARRRPATAAAALPRHALSSCDWLAHAGLALGARNAAAARQCHLEGGAAIPGRDSRSGQDARCFSDSAAAAAHACSWSGHCVPFHAAASRSHGGRHSRTPDPERTGVFFLLGCAALVALRRRHSDKACALHPRHSATRDPGALRRGGIFSRAGARPNTAFCRAFPRPRPRSIAPRR